MCDVHRCAQCCAILTRADHDADGDIRPWCIDCTKRCPRCRLELHENAPRYLCCPGCRRTNAIEAIEREFAAELEFGIPGMLNHEDRLERLGKRLEELRRSPL